MKGAFLVSEQPDLGALVLDALRDAGAEVTADGVGQLRDEQGRLFTVFARLDPNEGWDWRDGPVTHVGEGPKPDMQVSSACWIECRWEELFVANVRALAFALADKSWVLDGDDVLWPAEDVDAARVRL